MNPMQNTKSYSFIFTVRLLPPHTPYFIERGIQYASFQMGLTHSEDPSKQTKVKFMLDIPRYILEHRPTRFVPKIKIKIMGPGAQGLAEPRKIGFNI